MTNLKDLLRDKLRRKKHLTGSDPTVNVVKDTATPRGAGASDKSRESSESNESRSPKNPNIYLAAKVLLTTHLLKRPKVKRTQSLPSFKPRRAGGGFMNLIDPLRRKHRHRPHITKTRSEADVQRLCSDKVPQPDLYDHHLRQHRLLKQERIHRTKYGLPVSSEEGGRIKGKRRSRGVLGILKRGEGSQGSVDKSAVSEPAGICMKDFSYRSPDIVSPALLEELRLKGFSYSALGRMLGPNRPRRSSSAGRTPPYRDVDPSDDFGATLNRPPALGLYAKELQNGESLEEYVETIPSQWRSSILAIPSPVQFGQGGGRNQNQIARRWTMAFYLFLTSIGFLLEAIALSLKLVERRRREDFGARTNTNTNTNASVARIPRRLKTMVILFLATYFFVAFCTQLQWFLGRRMSVILFPGQALLLD